ncbi:MAG: hypothetical protein K6U04_15575 [Armatimonadetes bacterium]|nr:hypothetical protein [Armatimonadota bacterium]
MSPFETEVGIHDGAWVLLGFLAIWIRSGFWHAVVPGWSFFMIGAGIGHLKDTVVHGNYAPYNFGMIFFRSRRGVVIDRFMACLDQALY